MPYDDFDDHDSEDRPPSLADMVNERDRQRRARLRWICTVGAILAAVGAVLVTPIAGRHLSLHLVGYVLAGLVVPCLLAISTSLWLRSAPELRARRLAVALLLLANLGFITLGLWHASYIVRRFL